MFVVCGSLNVDEVFEVNDIVRPGETISSTSFAKHPGGKGANQAVAVASAGGNASGGCYHAGKIGMDGQFLVDTLRSHGVKTDLVQITGRAIIQVSSGGENSIILHPGANHAITREDVRNYFRYLTGQRENNHSAWLLLQNEISPDALSECIRIAKEQGFTVVLNPAPCPPNLKDVCPIQDVDVLILNEVESQQLCSSFGHSVAPTDTTSMFGYLFQHLPSIQVIVITLGSQGAVGGLKAESGILSVAVPALAIVPVDTTAAGDTFVGYFTVALAMHKEKTLEGLRESMKMGVVASAIACERRGAIPSIPKLEEVLMRLSTVREVNK
ncbi:hypothetical protein HDU97_001729 [Phlyctochytrium planicorne]|nr:hypothetical protein HDU97_001729 [Phlyctochytrium planicorne]